VGQDRLADVGVDLHANREPDRGLAAVQVGQQRSEPKGVLVGAWRALLGVAVSQDQGCVRVHDQQLNIGVGASRPGPGVGAGVGQGSAQPGQPIGTVATRSSTRQTVGMEATSPNSSGWSRKAAGSLRRLADRAGGPGAQALDRRAGLAAGPLAKRFGPPGGQVQVQAGGAVRLGPQLALDRGGARPGMGRLVTAMKLAGTAPRR
jgi:hypothetical protein